MRNIVLIVFLLFSCSIFAQTWQQFRTMPSPRHHPVTFEINGEGYMITGTNTANRSTKDVYKYLPLINLWTQATDFPGDARSFSMGASYKGVGYLGFGADNSIYFRDLWSYDAANDTWTELASCPCTARRHPTFMVNNDKIYVGLGNSSQSDLNDFWVYDIKTNSWSQLPNIPGPARHHPFHFTAGGDVYAGMGHGGPVIYKDWYKLDTVNNSWITLNDFPGEARVAGTQFSFDGYGYVLSGDGDNHSFMPTGEFWQYDHNSDTWNQFPSHPGVSRWAPGSMTIGPDVYFFGGTDRQAGNFPSASWKYRLAPPVSIETAIDETFTVFPNPANDILSWKSENKVTEIKLTNMLGQQVLHDTNPGESIRLGEFQNGMYIAQFYSNGELLNTKRVLVQH
ncbi:MAG: kelch repeat-containing protein [Bacteroidia bacterium]